MEEKNLDPEQERALSDHPPFSGRTTKLLGLFAATALAVSVGCSDSSTSNTTTAPASSNVAVGPDGQPIDESDYCLDDNDDGYCDEDGSRINTNTFIWIGGIDIDIDHKKKKYYKSGKPDSSHTYYPSSSGVSSGTSGSTATSKPSSNTSQPPTSAKGTGQVINKSAASSGTGSSSSKSSSGSVSSSSGSSSSSSSSSGVSSSSGKGGIGSSSSSSSS